MNEFILAEYNDKYLVKQLQSPRFVVVCDTKSIAHHLALSYNLGTMDTPLDNPRLFTEVDEIEGIKAFSLSLVSPNIRVDEEAQINDCCQSGCSGCPFYNA